MKACRFPDVSVQARGNPGLNYYIGETLLISRDYALCLNSNPELCLRINPNHQPGGYQKHLPKDLAEPDLEPSFRMQLKPEP